MLTNIFRMVNKSKMPSMLEKARFDFCVTLIMKAVCSYSAHGRFERTLAPPNTVAILKKFRNVVPDWREQ